MRANRLKDFIDSEATSALPLLVAALLALVLANSPLAGSVQGLLDTRLGLSWKFVDLDKPLLLWINDGLMAFFFLLVGLEIKREVMEGSLSQPSQVALPIAGAIGGMAVPAALYVAFNWSDPVALRGWAIPAATDIAFSLGVLAALGSRVPLALKVFLTTLAIVDDLGSILIIAIFYTDHLSALALALAGLCIVGLAILNATDVRRLAPYLVLGGLLWVSVLESGVHATLAGVVLALFIPLKSAGEADAARPAIHLEHAIKPWSAWFIMPVFAFANAGLPLAGVSLASLAAPLPLGIVAGLFLGKQIGIMLGAGLLIVLGIAGMPAGG
ncbi:MAG TPA: Na+/H+ antiporter NhaA, partial [Reyranella sp.]